MGFTIEQGGTGNAMPEAENIHGDREGGFFAGQSDPAKSNAATEDIPGGGFGGAGSEHPSTWNFTAVICAAGRINL